MQEGAKPNMGRTGVLARKRKPRLELLQGPNANPSQSTESKTSKESIKECRLARRSAVDTEILLYLGNLAKKNNEGFVYPSPGHIANTIRRTAYYTSQRLKFLEFTGRLIPTTRKMFGRELRGWIVVRHRDWCQQKLAVSPSSESEPRRSERENFAQLENNLTEDAKNFAHAGHQKSATAKKKQGLNSIGPPENLGLRSKKPSTPMQSLSQFTRQRTATCPADCAKNPFEKPRTPEEKLLRAIARVAEQSKSSFQELLNDESGIEKIAFWPDAKAAFLAIGYEYDFQDATFSVQFVMATCVVFRRYGERLLDGELKLSSFCCKVIDEQLRNWGGVFPNSFLRHRDALKEQGK